MNVVGFEFPDDLHYLVDEQVWGHPFTAADER